MMKVAIPFGLEMSCSSTIKILPEGMSLERHFAILRSVIEKSDKQMCRCLCFRPVGTSAAGICDPICLICQRQSRRRVGEWECMRARMKWLSNRIGKSTERALSEVRQQRKQKNDKTLGAGASGHRCIDQGAHQLHPVLMCGEA